MSSELKPCPFCGNKVVVRGGFGGITFFKCTERNCGAIVSFCGDKYVDCRTTEAVKPKASWNRRRRMGRMCNYCGETTTIYKTGKDAIAPLGDKFCSQCGEALTEPKPLTLPELRERDGKPVWIDIEGDRAFHEWNLVSHLLYENKIHIGFSMLCVYGCKRLMNSDYGKTWLAYDREPRKDV